jgi:hypothetical protein
MISHFVKTFFAFFTFASAYCFAQCPNPVPATFLPNGQSQFNLLALGTCNEITPNRSTTGTGAMGTSFPTVSGGGAAVGTQGGFYVAGAGNAFIPFRAGVINQGTLTAYVGTTFQCVGQSQCNANWSWFDLTTLDANNVGFTCQAVLDNNGIYTLMPGATNQSGNFASFNSLGSSAMTTGGGGATSIFTNSANYTQTPLPAKGGAWGSQYGWCGGVFDSVHGMEYFAPTHGGIFCNPMLVQYNQGGGAWPAQFDIANFTPFDLRQIGGQNACGYLSILYDGGKFIYLIPTSGAPMISYDTTQSFSGLGHYKAMLLASLNTPGNPQVTGNGNVGQVQFNGYYVGGQMVWVGTQEYMYLFPFGQCQQDCVTQAGKILQSNVIRVPVATCSVSAQTTQVCGGTLTATNALNSSQTWEMFDLGNLAVNGMTPAPVYTSTNTFSSNATSDFLGIGGFQFGWLNIHNTADPIVGMLADFGNFMARHHATKSLSDFTAWDIYPKPANQKVACAGGGYDPVNQWFYPSCATANIGQIGPL